MVQALEEAEFAVTHVRGSHRYLQRSNGARLVGVPVHGNRDLPSLTFLSRVEDDLRNLQHACVRPVVNQLLKLEQAVAEWPHGHEAPQWKTKVTGEYEMREKLCEFTDLDGVVRVFELHARFTPGAGRVHFRLVPEYRTATGAYIGRKIGS